MTLILSNADVEKLLTMPECIDVLEDAYVELAEGRGVSRTRSDCITPTSRPDAVYGLKSMDGVIPKLGIGAIRGSGDHGGEFARKGGVGAFRQMLATLAQGCSVTLTADVPKVTRIAGSGIVRLAAVSGRPIYLVAIATRNRITLDNWDRTEVNLPFGRGGIVGRDTFCGTLFRHV